MAQCPVEVQIDWPMTSTKSQGWVATQQLWKSFPLYLMPFLAENQDELCVTTYKLTDHQII